MEEIQNKKYYNNSFSPVEDYTFRSNNSGERDYQCARNAKNR